MKGKREHTETMSDNEIYERMNELFMSIETGASTKKRTCQYYLNNGNRYCSATTHARCDGCKMYSPTMQAKMRVILERYFRRTDYIEELKMLIQKKDQKIKRLEEDIELANEEIAYWKGGQNEETVSKR